jgi:hypothetical protein
MESEKQVQDDKSAWDTLSPEEQKSRILAYIHQGLPPGVPGAQIMRGRIVEEMHQICDGYYHKKMYESVLDNAMEIYSKKQK